MRFSITSLDDSSEDLDGLLPVKGTVLRQIPGPDRPDYHLAAVDSPFEWKKEKKKISHIILAGHLVGAVLSPTMRGVGVGIAYVLDDAVLSDATLDFKKCFYAAIGFVDALP
jgi:hypothetical protein